MSRIPCLQNLTPAQTDGTKNPEKNRCPDLWNAQVFVNRAFLNNSTPARKAERVGNARPPIEERSGRRFAPGNTRKLLLQQKEND